jgi:hypothetical protein
MSHATHDFLQGSVGQVPPEQSSAEGRNIVSGVLRDAQLAARGPRLELLQGNRGAWSHHCGSGAIAALALDRFHLEGRKYVIPSNWVLSRMAANIGRE